MKIEVTMAQPVLPCAPQAEVVFLTRLSPEAAAGNRAVDVRFALDRSWSMRDPSGVGQQCKLDVLKQACAAAVDRLRLGDRAGVWAFAAQTSKPMPWRVLSRAADLAMLRKAIGGLQAQVGTAFAGAVGGAVAQPVAGDATGLVVFVTDGIPYCPDVAAERAQTLASAERAGERGLTMLVFGTGVEYDEAFLRSVAERAGGGSRYAHVQRLDELAQELLREIELGATAPASAVEVVIAPAAGVELVEVTAMLPAQHDVAVGPAGARERAGVLDARGRAYVVRARIADAAAPGARAVARVDVTWREGGAARQGGREALVELTADGSRVSAVDPVVRATLLTAAGARATVRGDLGLARTLFGSAGNATALQALDTLGTAGDEDSARALRTRVLLPSTLGTAKGDQ